MTFTIGKHGTFSNTGGTWDHRTTHRSLSAAVRHLVQRGVGITPGAKHGVREWYIRPITPKGTPDHGASWSVYFHRFSFDLTEEQYNVIAALVQRYRAFLAACEVEREWQEIPGSRVAWADNSMTHQERDKYGHERTIYDTHPHGDRCF